MIETPYGVEIRNLVKKFGSNEVLKGISMHFGAGLLHGLIGPEGSGKTTLLRTCLGLLHPSQGEVIYSRGGVPVPFQDVRQEIAYLPQQQSLYSDLSISEHLNFFRELYRIPHELYIQKRDELLRITQLTPFAERPAGELSGGMYKKLGLMCSLLRSPQVLLLDEPTTGVDPLSRREFWGLLQELSRQKILILLATSYMDEAEKCDQVHLIEYGECFSEGEPKVLLEKEGVQNFNEFFIRHA